MVRDRFVDEAATMGVDNQRPGFAPVEHKVRKDRLRSVPAAPDRRGRPECSAEIPVADAGADLNGLVLRVTGQAWRNAGPLRIGSQFSETPLGVAAESTARENQPAID